METKKIFIGNGDTISLADVNDSDGLLDFSLGNETITRDWKNKAKEAYDLLVASYQAHPNSIPFFFTTDQHSVNGLDQHRCVHNLDVDGIGLANINLGDSDQNFFNFAQLNLKYSRIKGIQNYIGVVGNHDVWHGSIENAAAGSDGTIPRIQQIKRVFGTSYVGKVECGADNDTYCVYDDDKKVKYLCVDTFYDIKNLYKHNGLTKENAEFIIECLTEDSIYDIVLLQHIPLVYTMPHIYEKIDGTDWKYGVGQDGLASEAKLFVDRKNKVSGTLTDKDGNVHSYDFSGCTKNLLCCLFGHQHDEMTCIDNNLRMFVGDLLTSDYKSYFGLIDRDSNLLRIWRVTKSSVSNEIDLSI